MVIHVVIVAAGNEFFVGIEGGDITHVRREIGAKDAVENL